MSNEAKVHKHFPKKLEFTKFTVIRLGKILTYERIKRQYSRLKKEPEQEKE
jgi:hypothetical protein